MKTGVYRELLHRWVGGGARALPEITDRESAAQDPLQADRYSRALRSPHELSLVAKNPPLRERFGSLHPQGYYLYSLGLPESLFGENQIEELSVWIRGLNFYLKKPITDFSWNQPDCGRYSLGSHQVWLRPEWHIEPSSRAASAKATITHEMMHGIFHSMGFAEDAGWRSIYHLSLAWKNYEIFDDSNYLGGRSDYYGHPYDNASEAFASAGTAYYFKADLLAAYIANPRTPESMKLAGQAAWCFFRDRVFDGEVFTADGIDPLAGESLAERMSEVDAMEPEALWQAFLSSDPDVRDPARQGLANLFNPAAPLPADEYALADAAQQRSLNSFAEELPYHLLDILEGGEVEAQEAALHRMLQDHYADISEDLLDACLRLAKDGDSVGDRKLAIQALAAIQDKSGLAVNNRAALALTAALDDPDAEMRSAAETVLRTRSWLELQPEVDRILAKLPPVTLWEGIAYLLVGFRR